MNKLPPLNSLKAFDAAARRLSFTAAAKELHVTHGAVSRQVQQLEEFLDRQLFLRLARGLELTAHGRMLSFTTRNLFEQLEYTVEEIRGHKERNMITISTVPSLAARWLVPRLQSFHSLYPGTEVRISTTAKLVDFDRDDVDLGIRYGRGNWPGLYTKRLFNPREFPVCAPSLLEGKQGLHKPNDLAMFPLLHDMTHAHWGAWLELAGADKVNAQAGLVLEDSNVLLQAAIEGQGVALASEPLVRADLRAGRLVKPFEIELPVELGFYLVCPETYKQRPAIQAIMNWLITEANE